MQECWSSHANCVEVKIEAYFSTWLKLEGVMFMNWTC